MAQTGVYIRRTAAHAIPTPYIEAALKENPTAWGAAIVTPDGLIKSSGDGADVQLIEDTLKEFDERDIHFYLCNSESAVNVEDDVSPHVIVEAEDGSPMLVAFVTGDFQGYKKMDSTHPSSYFFLQEMLSPKIEGLWELCDGDLSKVWLQIEKPLFKKELMNGVADGTVSLLANNGKCLTFHAGKDSSEYPWGWVSHNYGYALAKPEPEKKVEAERKGMFPQKNKSTVREKHVPSESVVAQTPIVGAQVVKNYTIRKEKPRSTDSRQDRKSWYQRRIGYAPFGWERNLEIDVWVDPDTNQTLTMTDIKKLGLDVLKLPKLNNPPRVKDTAPDNIESGQPTGPAVDVNKLPVMSPKAREYFKDILRREDVKKMLAENGEAVTDPARIAEDEQKIVGFSEQLGTKTGMLDAAKICHISYAAQVKWGQESPESYNVFVRSLINFFLSTEAKKSNKLTSEEVHTVAKEELAPPKKSMFPQKKVATG